MLAQKIRMVITVQQLIILEMAMENSRHVSTEPEKKNIVVLPKVQKLQH
jgi:hypothetical protein